MTDEQNDKRFEKDPKIAARDERYTPEVEKLLRINCMNLDGPKGTTRKFRDNFDRVFKTQPHPNEPEAAEALQNAGPREDIAESPRLDRVFSDIDKAIALLQAGRIDDAIGLLLRAKL